MVFMYTFSHFFLFIQSYHHAPSNHVDQTDIVLIPNRDLKSDWNRCNIFVFVNRLSWDPDVTVSLIVCIFTILRFYTTSVAKKAHGVIPALTHFTNFIRAGGFLWASGTSVIFPNTLYQSVTLRIDIRSVHRQGFSWPIKLFDAWTHGTLFTLFTCIILQSFPVAHATLI